MIKEVEEKHGANWITSAILQSIDGFFDWSIPTGRMSLSTPMKQLLGYTREHFSGDNKHFFQENLHSGDMDRVLGDLINSFKSHKERVVFECRLKKKAGDYLWVRIQGRIFRNEAGMAQHFAGIVLDVSEERQHISETKENSQAKSKFIATLNHELRSPLASIMNASDLILEEPLSDKQTRYVRNIKQSADLLLKLVNDILDMSKIDAGKLVIEYQPFSFQNLVDSSIDMLKPSALQKGLYLENHIDKALPQTIISDSTRLQQIILNFASNAIKFTKIGGVKINAQFKPVNKHKAKLYVEVVDTGIGIPEERISGLFKDFMQADISTSRIYGGTGLGLSICKKIVGLMGGEIGLRSKEGVGSVFWFDVSVDLVQTEKDKSKTDSKAYPSRVLKKLKILVVEDNMVNQQVMMGLLEKLGHEVVVAENGQIAVDFVRENPFDLIFMDINMPVKDGIEACKEIRTFNKNIPIIAITANGMTSEKERCLNAGMDSFATKPVDTAKLELLVSPYLTSEGGQKITQIHNVNHGEITSEILINKDSIYQLIGDLGEGKVKRLLDLYQQDAPGLIMNLEKNIDAERSAHTLAGMSENLNFTAISHRSRSILQMVREQREGADLQSLVTDLASIYKETIKEVSLILP